MTDEARPPKADSSVYMKPTPPGGMPAQPPTANLPAMTDRAILEDLVRTANKGFGEVRLMRGDVDLLVGDMASLKVDVRELQKWKISSEERAERHSGGVKSTAETAQKVSANDLAQDAAIGIVVSEVAKEREAREALDAKVDDVKAKVELLDAKLEENNVSTELIRTAVTGVGGFLKQHPGVVTGIATLIASVLGWIAHAIH